MRRWLDRSSVARAGTISGRLILYLALAVVLTAVAVSVVTFVLGSRDARDRVVGQLKSVAALKQQEIVTWQSNVYLNLDIVLSNPTTTADLRTLAEPVPRWTSRPCGRPTAGCSNCSFGPPRG